MRDMDRAMFSPALQDSVRQLWAILRRKRNDTNINYISSRTKTPRDAAGRMGGEGARARAREGGTPEITRIKEKWW